MTAREEPGTEAPALEAATPADGRDDTAEDREEAQRRMRDIVDELEATSTDPRSVNVDNEDAAHV